MELFVGAAAIAATATTAAVPATAGLIGAGGVVTAGGVAGAVGVTTAAVGGIAAASGASQQAQSQAAMSEFNAKMQEREAQQIEQQTLFRQQRQAKESERIRSALQADIGGAGIDMGSGTPLLIQSTQAEESELDNLLIGAQGRNAASRARSQGALDTMQAGVYRQRGRNYRTVGRIDAATTLLQGFGELTKP